MTIVSAIASLVTATVALVALIGGYVQFVLRRSLLPAIEFDVEFGALDRGPTQLVGEVRLVVRNLGANTLILTNVRCRIRYRVETDPEQWWTDGVQPELAHAVPQFFIARGRTFVQPGVSQRYRHPVALPAGTRVVDLLGAFDYRLQVGPVTGFLIGLFARPPKDLDWRRGVRNHTGRRVVAVPAGSG